MKITIKNLQKKIPVNPRKIKEIVLRVLKAEGKFKCGQLCIIFVTDRKIRSINRKYRKKDYATDVIAFDLSDDSRILIADIVISGERASSNARIFATNPRYESYLYVVHGLLHLLGYGDKTAKQCQIMNKKATKILSKLKIKGSTISV